jgi:hypothetical protein
MKKRISLNEWTSIGKYNPAAKWLRPLCKYTLTLREDGCFMRECKISWPVYLILFIPVHLLQALYCLWNGGLREFEIGPRHLGYNTFNQRFLDDVEPYNRCKEIWEKKNKGA